MNRRPLVRLFATWIAVLLLPALTLAAPKPKAAASLKLGTLAPRDSSFHNILKVMGTKWKEAPDGGVDLRIYPGGAAGGEADMVRKMRIGQLDAALLTVAGLSEIDQSVEALQSMPMMFRSLDEVDYIGEKLRPRLSKNLRDKGFVVLFWGDAGWVRFFSKEPVVHPADLKRMKLFTWAGDVDAFDIYKAAGYRPVPLETNDILPSLSTRMIDAVPLPPYVAMTTQVYAEAPHMLELNWAPLVGGLVVTERSWNKLPPATQAMLARAAGEAGTQMKIQNRAESDRAVAEMVKRNLKVQKVSPEIEAEWRQAASAAYGQIRGKIVPADLFDEVQKLLAEYRAGVAKKTAAK
jgi:TRAP-type C4-dicarboxylate transport system substrate-binding protein